MPDDAKPDRLGLARWLMEPEHPLTARVTVNRFWQQLFGLGIVETSGDFGTMGQRPSHPQLLDWLAVDFQNSGWDIKRLLKQIVMSQTYQQSSDGSAQSWESDPQNRLLSRGPRFRMDAEMIRDQALQVSGLLVPKIGGPSVKPYQPPGIWFAVGYTRSNTAKFVQDEGENLYRRSLYTFWKRTAAPPSMEVFNAPARELCTVQRERTNTPLQALTLMNDPQFLEAARHFATNALKASKHADDRINFMTMRALARNFTSEERELILSSLRAYQDAYKDDPQSAKELIVIGDSPPDETLPPSALASWTMVASQILNFDETITKN